MAYEDYHVNADDVKLDGDPNIRRTVPPSPSGSGGGISYGTCTTAAATAAKVVTLTDASGWELKQGASVAVKFSNTNTFSATAQDPVTLNVNNTGAKNIYYGGSANPTGTNTTAFGRANYVNTYVYDGTYWVWTGSSADNNTTYSAMSKSELTTGTATTSRVVRADYLKKGIEEIIKAPITDIVNVYGAKNLIPYDYLTSSQVVNGITVTPLKDGTYKLNGTATSFTDIRLSPFGTSSYDACLTLEKGAYILSGTPISSVSGGTGKANVGLVINDGTNRSNLGWDFGDGYTLVHSDTSIRYEIKIGVPQGITLSDVVFKPMLRLASIQDDTYVPYAKTNKELTIDTSNIKDSVSSISITGTKNITGATIAEDTYFYLNGELVRSKADIASGATLTLNTNYEVTTAGGLNEVNRQLKDALNDIGTVIEAVKYNPAVPGGGAQTTVAVLNITPGEWMVHASGWSPIGQATATATHAVIKKYVESSNVLPFMMTSLFTCFDISGYVKITEGTQICLEITNYDGAVSEAGKSYSFYAVRVK